jgi:hypothetical protein
MVITLSNVPVMNPLLRVAETRQLEHFFEFAATDVRAER